MCAWLLHACPTAIGIETMEDGRIYDATMHENRDGCNHESIHQDLNASQPAGMMEPQVENRDGTCRTMRKEGRDTDKRDS